MNAVSSKCVPLWEKYALSVDEAAEVFGIGQNRLRSIIASNPDAEYLVTVGTKTMIKRKIFEKYLDTATAIQAMAELQIYNDRWALVW